MKKNLKFDALQEWIERYGEDFHKMKAFFEEYNKHSDDPELQKRLKEEYLKQGGLLDMPII